MERIILHSDANCFYASVETLYNPDLRGKPIAVCGDPEARHGIVLTKSQEAKKYGVQTAEPIWQAKKKCPQLIVVPPDFPLYLEFSQLMRDIYNDYTDKIEPFGLDEAWLDISDPGLTIKKATVIADGIRDRIREELGITVSIGVSFNKIFAKLGSDMKKPDATTAISREDYKDKVWPLATNELLFCGTKTALKLGRINVHTIGDLANTHDDVLKSRLGINGIMLKTFALGNDMSPVQTANEQAPIKGIGNSTTAPHDIETLDDARCILYLLSECVAMRLRKHGFMARVISINARTPNLVGSTVQRTLRTPTNLTDEIARTAIDLFASRYAAEMPFRSIGVHCGQLQPEDAPEQLDMLGDSIKRAKMLSLEREVDNLRGRFGYEIIRRGVTMADREFATVNPTGHIQPAAPFYTGK